MLQAEHTCANEIAEYTPRTYMRLCRYTVRINRLDDGGNTIAHGRKIERAEVKAMRFQGRRRASVWCRSRMELLKCFSISWRRDTITVSRLLLASVIAKLGP